MDFDQETTTLLLDYFATNLHSSASRDLQGALKKNNAEDLWICWTKKISSRVDHLALDIIEEALSWGELCSCEKQGSSCDVRVVLDFLKQFVRFHRNTVECPPLRWLEYVADSEEILKILPEQMHPDEVPLLNQILLGEFRLFLGLLYPELIPFRSFAQSGKRQLIQGIETLVNEKGMPAYRNIFELRGLLACWTRSLLLATDAGQVLFPTSAMRRFEWTILQAMQWTRSDGSSVLSPFKLGTEKPDKDFLRRLLDLIDAALHFDEDGHDGEIASVLLAPFCKKTGRIPYFAQQFPKEKIDPDLLPEATCFVDDLTMSVQKANWTPESPAVYLAADSDERIDVVESKENAADLELYDKQTLTELRISGETVLSGTWNVSIKVNGQTLRPASSWQQICCQSDETYSYLEWCLLFAGDYRLERRCILVPDEKIILLGDTLRKKTYSDQDKPDFIEYRSDLPLAPHFSALSNDLLERSKFQKTNLAATKTKDSKFEDQHKNSQKGSEKQNAASKFTSGNIFIIPRRLTGSKALARLVPFSFENTEFDENKICGSDQSIQMLLSGKGTSVFAPVIIDYDTSRIKKPATVRRLTVAEKGVPVSEEKALGFRVQLGKDQYIIYQSLGGNEVRTVIGLHLLSDFVLAKFDKETGPHSLIDIELT